MKFTRIFFVFSLILLCASVYPCFAKAPDTAKIVFTSTRDGNSEIYVMNPDGSDQVNLTQRPSNDFDPVWSPTGNQILFVSDRNGTADLYFMDADGGNVKQVFRRALGRQHPTWAPDGKRIAYARTTPLQDDAAIYIASIDGESEERITSGLSPVWAPDGSEITFILDITLLIEDDGPWIPIPGIGIVNPQTRAEKTLLPKETFVRDPAWSPDSTKIAFSWVNTNLIPVAAALGGQNLVDLMTIYVMNRDGSELKEIVAVDDTKTSTPTWAPQGDALIYQQRLDGEEQLFKTTFAGGISEQLTHDGSNSNADWFDPAYALPVLPQPHLLTTVWGKIKIQD